MTAALLPLLLAALSSIAAAPPTLPKVSYTRQLRPLFEKQCLGCHNSGPEAGGGYVMNTRELLLKGGRHGAAVTPGSGAKSLLLRYLTGEMQPRMPSGGSPVDRDTIQLIRRWIDEGAIFDKAAPEAAAAVAPATKEAGVPATAAQAAPATALCYAPDGAHLAVAGYRAVRLLDASTGAVAQTLGGFVDQVQSVAFSNDGKYLAAAGGTPGERGEVIVFDGQTGKPLRTFGAEHTDVVSAIAWRPGTMQFATGSLDKTIRVWDAATGKCLRVIKEHADAVLGLAYSPDGKLLATGSADRGAKLLDAETGRSLGALTAHQEAVTHVAFNRDGTLLATCGADKTVRVWKVAPGNMPNPERTLNEGDFISACVFSADNNLLVYGAANQTVKAFNGDGAQFKRTFAEAKDWIYCVAVSPDSRTIAAGSQDGRVFFWEAGGDGKLLRFVRLAASKGRTR